MEARVVIKPVLKVSSNRATIHLLPTTEYYMYILLSVCSRCTGASRWMGSPHVFTEKHRLYFFSAAQIARVVQSYMNSIDWASRTVWAAVKKYSHAASSQGVYFHKLTTSLDTDSHLCLCSRV